MWDHTKRRSDFLNLLISMRAWRQLDRQLTRKPELLLGKRELPLLGRLLRSSSPNPDDINIAIIKTLLRHGADPN
jgi:hypothetical protein